MIVSPSSSQKGSSLSSPTNVDIMAEISSLQNSHTDIINSYNKLSESQSQEFKELRTSLVTLSSQITDLKQENVALRNEVSALRARVDLIESVADVAPPNTQSDLLAQVISESSDRERCIKNIVIRGLSVCDSTNVDDRISADKNILSELFTTLNISLPAYHKPLRVGRVASGTCPTKVIIYSSADATCVLHDVQRAKKSGLLPQHISIVRDKTKRERDLFRTAYAELERRRADGESDLIVSYVNGIPKATKRPSKN